MGNYLKTSGSSLAKNPTAFKLVNNLRAKMTLEKICTCFNLYMQDCYPNEELTYDEYDSVFCTMLNNTVPLFEVLSVRGQINIYEILISLVVFETNSEFEDKVSMIFKAFDVDGGGTLDRQELEKFLICGISGLCKMVGLSAPSRIGITEFTYEQFKIIDEDESGTIEHDEFNAWVSTTREIQDFLCIYTGVQTHAFAKKRFE